VKGLCAVLATALLTASATLAHHKSSHEGGAGSERNQGFITREWTTTDATAGTRTTLTAYGPPGQVNRVDPQDSTPECHNCQLASSIQLLPGDDSDSD
jgi:hypothetical protein